MSIPFRKKVEKFFRPGIGADRWPVLHLYIKQPDSCRHCYYKMQDSTRLTIHSRSGSRE